MKTLTLALTLALFALASCGKHETKTPPPKIETTGENLPVLSASEAAILAIQSNEVGEFVNLCQTHDLNLNSVQRNGRTFLIEAVEWSRIEIIKWLLAQESIDVEAKDNEGKSALEHAQIIGDREVLKLLGSGAMSQEEIDTSLFTALYAKDQNQVKEAIEAGANLDIHDKKGLTPLIIAIYQKDEMAIRLILQTRRVDVNLRDLRTNKTPLAWARRSKLSRVEKMLERMGAHE